MIRPEILSIHRSFVLRIYGGIEVGGEVMAGRIEHIVTGDIREFRSAGELFNAITLLLHRDDSDVECSRKE